MENGIVNIINGLNTEKYFHLICSLTKERQFEERIRVPNYTIVDLNKKEGNDITIPFKLRKAFREHNIRIVHLRGWPTLIEGILGSKLANAKKIIYGFHGKSYDELSSYKRRRHYAEKIGIMLVDKVITLAEPMKEELCARFGVNSDMVQIIHNGVNIEHFSHREDIKETKRELGIEEDDFVIGSVGRLDPVKNYITLIQAFELFTDKFIKSKLIIVGDGSERSLLKKAVSGTRVSNNIIFAGYQSSVRRFLQIMDIYVQTSLYEGFSNTIVEAMAAGLPVIATDVGGNRVLIDDGINGFLIRPKQPDILFSKLSALKNDISLLRDMSQRCRQSTREKYSLERMIKEYDRCYNNLFASI